MLKILIYRKYVALSFVSFLTYKCRRLNNFYVTWRGYIT